MQSTLFNAVVENGKAAAANFPFCTIEPNTGIVTVPDERLAILSKISGSKELVRAAFLRGRTGGTGASCSAPPSPPRGSRASWWKHREGKRAHVPGVPRTTEHEGPSAPSQPRLSLTPLFPPLPPRPARLSGRRQLPATVEFVDIAGLVKGASKGEGMGNQFLTNIRDTNAICQVVRCFEDDDIIHVNGKVSWRRCRGGARARRQGSGLRRAGQGADAGIHTLRGRPALSCFPPSCGLCPAPVFPDPASLACFAAGL